MAKPNSIPNTASNNPPNSAQKNVQSCQPLIVQKYGGATLSDPQKIKEVAKRIADLHGQGTNVLAVVSAMGKTTNQLIELAKQVSNHPNRREMDMLLTTGERVSMALLAMALHDQNVQAISFTGSQAGILTDNSHVNAFITEVKALRVDEALKNGKVAVLAGFQGVSPETKEITTLGRGGSDTTAVAMAAYLNANCCEILKDVAAVFSADPKLVSNAKQISELTYDQLCEMTFWGAKVLHFRSAELAKRMRVKLYIGPAAETHANGTVISERTTIMYEAAKVLAINSHEKVLCLSLKTKSIVEAFNQLKKFFDQNEIAFPQILLTEKIETSVKVFLTGPNEILQAIEQEAKPESPYQLGPAAMASVTATCAGSTSANLSEMILSSLDAAAVDVQGTIMSPMSTTVLVKSQDRQKAIAELHRLI